MIKDSIYFISIVPPKPLESKLQQMKQIFAEKYKVYHALKSPPHITLIPPFKLEEYQVKLLSEFLQDFTSGATSFTISIKNFGCFTPRVIYLRPLINENLNALYMKIRQEFYAKFPVNTPSPRPFHPHLTIAFRDLKPDVFEKAWAEYRSKSLEEDFSVDRIHLLKHNGASWDVLRDFRFQNNHLPG